MNAEDLKLVPIEDLISEIMDRTESCVLGYTKMEDPGAPFVYVNHKCAEGWLTGVGLCDAIKVDLFNKNFHPDEDE